MSLLIDTMTLQDGLTGRMIDAPGAAVLEDRRSVPRMRRRLKVMLTGMGDVGGVECQSVDISEGGMCVKTSAASALRVGQRIDVTVPSNPDPQTGKSAFVTTCYATIVRSHTTVDDKSSVTLGLRFDHPFFF